tara:strand:- start:12457 stop:12954 length:498 start_codon:yes stop_codon:yes gene_type:complete
VKFRKSGIAVLAITIAICIAPAPSFAGDKEKSAVDLSPELMTLLKAEMGALGNGIQSVALSIATADWKAVNETAKKMHASYIMKKSLTPAQSLELRQKLPSEFKRLDMEFHARAKQLAQATESPDPELIAFRYSRLVEGCANCHSVFASKRFPGFEYQPKNQNQH